MITEKLAEEILFAPISQGFDHLLVLSGYATPNMTSWFIKSLQERKAPSISLSILVGMVPYDGVSEAVHEGFKELMRDSYPGIKKFSCSYVYGITPVHANLYIWLKNDTPVLAYVGSAEFMQNAFLSGRADLMTECDPEEAFRYYSQQEKKSIYCNHCEVEEAIVLHKTHTILDNEFRAKTVVSGAGTESLTLSLCSETGDVGRKSGLNWGQRDHRNRNEAYIPLPSKDAKSGFFPLNKQHFTVETDDGHFLLLRVEQQSDKAITTPLRNANLGEYFRNRLGLANGEYVTKEDLIKYGRTDVTFYKIDDETFYMDFSPKSTYEV